MRHGLQRYSLYALRDATVHRRDSYIQSVTLSLQFWMADFAEAFDAQINSESHCTVLDEHISMCLYTYTHTYALHSYT